jgi:hypothetical protein
MTDKAKWLAGLQVGDPVRLHYANHDHTRLRVIGHLTATMVVTEDGRRFRRRDGYKPGVHTYYFGWIEEPTAAQAHKAKGKAGR